MKIAAFIFVTLLSFNAFAEDGADRTPQGKMLHSASIVNSK